MLLFLWLLQLPSALRGAIDNRAQRRTRPVRCSREVPVIVSSLAPLTSRAINPRPKALPPESPRPFDVDPPGRRASPLVRSRDDLVAWIAAGSKPGTIGGSAPSTRSSCSTPTRCTPVPYEGPRGVRALMEGLIARFGWEPILEGDNIIALKRPEGEAGRHRVARARRPVRALRARRSRRCTRSAPRRTSTSTQVLSVGEPLGIGFLGVGFSPKWTLDETPRMPKQRYAGDDALHADGRHARPRHDVPHRDDPGEPRLRGRGRHGQEAARLAGAAADRDGAVRLLALSPRAASTASSRCAARSGATPTARAPACCRSRSSPAWATSATSTTRSACRCISSIAAAATSMSPAPRSGISWRGSCRELPGEMPTIDDWSDHLTTLFPRCA